MNTPRRGDLVRLTYNESKKPKHPAFVGHTDWTVLDYDPDKGVRTKMGWFPSWIRSRPA
jgi:hypothetical protein